MERYISLEFYTPKSPSRVQRISPVTASIVILTLLGMNVYGNIYFIIRYASFFDGCMDGMYKYFIIWIIIAVGCICHWGYSLKKRHVIGGQQEIQKGKVATWSLVLSILLVIEGVCFVYMAKVSYIIQEAEWMERVTSQ